MWLLVFDTTIILILALYLDFEHLCPLIPDLGKREGLDSEYGCIKDHVQMKIRKPNPSQEPPASSKAPNEDLKDINVLCTFEIKIENQNSDHGSMKHK